MPAGTKPALTALVPKIMADIGVIGKGQKNTAQGYAFRGIDDVYNAVQPAFIKHGVFCVPQVQNVDVQNTTTSKGKPAVRVVLTVKYIFHGPAGDTIEAVVVGEAMDSGDKAANKALSAAMKYAIWQTFCIPTAGAIDSEIDSPEMGTPDPATEAERDGNGEAQPEF